MPALASSEFGRGSVSAWVTTSRSIHTLLSFSFASSSFAAVSFASLSLALRHAPSCVLKRPASRASRPPSYATFAEDHDRAVPLWDAVLLDESHRAKNPKTKLYGALLQLRARTRVLVTGTPVQNNLLELHALFDLACPGLLGDRRFFNRRFASAIESSQVRRRRAAACSVSCAAGHSTWHAAWPTCIDGVP